MESAIGVDRHPHAFARRTAIFSAGRDRTVAGLFGPTIHPHFTGAVGNPSSSLPAESGPGADSAKENGMPRSICALFPGVSGRLLPMRSIRLTVYCKPLKNSDRPTNHDRTDCRGRSARD